MMIRSGCKRLFSSKKNGSVLSSSWLLNRNNNQINKGDNDVIKRSPSSSSAAAAAAAAAYHVSSGGSMRGLVFWETNKPLTIEEFNMPRPKAGEILIKTKGVLFFFFLPLFFFLKCPFSFLHHKLD